MLLASVAEAVHRLATVGSAFELAIDREQVAEQVQVHAAGVQEKEVLVDVAVVVERKEGCDFAAQELDRAACLRKVSRLTTNCFASELAKAHASASEIDLSFERAKDPVMDRSIACLVVERFRQRLCW